MRAEIDHSGRTLRRAIAGVGFVLVLTGGIALAQEKPLLPPADAVRLSATIAKVEARDGFHYIDEINWNRDGYYTVVYFTTDHAKVEIRYDAAGNPIPAGTN